MQNCTFDFGNDQQEGYNNGELQMGHMRNLGTIYQTDLVRLFSIMTEKEFKKMNCLFDCKHD